MNEQTQAQAGPSLGTMQIPESMRRRINQNPDQLPSSNAVKAAMRGESGGWFKVAMSTVLRSLLMTPGLYIVGVRGWKLLGGALLGSASITVFLFIFYAGKMGNEHGVQKTSTP